MRRRWVVGALAALAVLSLALAWFQPWKLFIDHRVTDVLPAVAVRTTEQPSPDPTTPATVRPRPRATPTRTPAAHDVLLARGSFISHEHNTSGSVSVVRLAGGRRVLAIAGLSTSDGPDVHVWLTDAPVRTGKNGWYVFDDGAHVSLGTLRGNLGDQVYAIPASADLTKLMSVTLWCDRFDVSFGAARLSTVSQGVQQ